MWFKFNGCCLKFEGTFIIVDRYIEHYPIPQQGFFRFKRLAYHLKSPSENPSGSSHILPCIPPLVLLRIQYRVDKQAEMEKVGCVLIFHSCAYFSFFFMFFIKVFFGMFCAILGIFALFWAFFAHILCANLSYSKFCVCYFVSFFHLCKQFWN